MIFQQLKKWKVFLYPQIPISEKLQAISFSKWPLDASSSAQGTCPNISPQRAPEIGHLLTRQNPTVFSMQSNRNPKLEWVPQDSHMSMHPSRIQKQIQCFMSFIPNFFPTRARKTPIKTLNPRTLQKRVRYTLTCCNVGLKQAPKKTWRNSLISWNKQKTLPKVSCKQSQHL